MDRLLTAVLGSAAMGDAVAPVVQLNGVHYRVPGAPVVVVSVDGGDPAYLTAARAAGVIPTIAGFLPGAGPPLRAAPSARGHRHPGGRSRHDRQVRRRRQLPHHLPAGAPGPALQRRHDSGDLSDHRCLRGPPRIAWRLPAGVLQRRCPSYGSGSCDPISLRKIGVSALIRYSILSSPE